MGPSGTGKTTLLRLITGQLRADSGHARSSRDRTCARCAAPAVRVAPAHGHAVSERGAAHRPERLRERGVPAAGAHGSSGAADPPAGADEAPGGGASRGGGAHARRALRRHGPACRARPCHRHGSRDPDLRRTLRGPGSHFARRHPAADPPLERRAGPHQHRGVPRRARDRHGGGCCYLLSGGKVAAHGAPQDLKPSPPRWSVNSSAACADGPVPFHFPAPDYFGELLARGEDL